MKANLKLLQKWRIYSDEFKRQLAKENETGKLNIN